MVLGQFMALLDIQIVNSSLTQIQAGISATTDEISWVQTIYLLAEVVVMPLTAYMTKMWGTRPFFVISCLGFVVSSMATGLSSGVTSMILFRALQGLFAGAMIPPAYAAAFTLFPPDRRMTANVAMGLIITLAPTIGPTLGGHLTELLGWRWLFFINVPVGVLAMAMVWRWADFDKGDAGLAKGFDWWGLGLMSVFLLAAQFVLEEGAKDGWFEDDGILWLTVLAVLSGVAFFWRELTYHQPVVSFRPFADRNFALGMVMMFVTGASLFGGSFLIPLFLGEVRRFSSGDVGNAMLASGLTMFVAAPIGGKLVRLLDARLAMMLGFGVVAWSIQLGVQVTEQWGFWQFALMQVVRGLGTMTAMIAAQQMSISTLPNEAMKDAAGLLNLIRNVAGAIGLAILTTVMSHQFAEHYTDLTSALSVGNATNQDLLAGFIQLMEGNGVADPEGGARKAFSLLLQRKALVLSFGDAFGVLSLGCWAAVALAIFARPGQVGAMMTRPDDLH